MEILTYILGLLLLISLGLLFRGRVTNKPLLSVAEKAEELSRVNKELNSSNKLLVEREIELNETNKKLREIDARKSEFVSIVAHQLRTPLAAVKWTLDLLINGDMGTLPDHQKSLLFKVIDSNERMIRFVNDLLSVSRVESGRLEYTFVPINLQHVAESVLLDIYPLANKKDININFRGKGMTLPSVAADTEKIRAVFQNLLENSVKYTSINGHITLELRNRMNDVLVSVQDDGIGIPKEEQKAIFNRFYRGSEAIKNQAEGSGLGLYLAKAIVEGHGGKIWFESEIGKGATFYFTIPVPRKTR
ncbi:MAG: HAMP domain-containing sensor histidine kinase [bacterium]|nr:HAMP domain-containing sensor histidine kinase [bacterium]